LSITQLLLQVGSLPGLFWFSSGFPRLLNWYSQVLPR